MTTEKSANPLAGISLSVALSIALAAVAAVGFITATQVNIFAGAAIFAVSLVLFAFTCTNTDLAELGI